MLQSLASDVTLTLTCAYDDTASKVLAAYDLVWEVDGLPKESYYNQSRAVVIKAYATASRLLEGNELKVGVRFFKKGDSAAGRRMMQEYSEEQTAASVEEGHGETIESNTDTVEETKPVDGGAQNVTTNKTLIQARNFSD